MVQNSRCTFNFSTKLRVIFVTLTKMSYIFHSLDTISPHLCNKAHSDYYKKNNFVGSYCKKSYLCMMISNLGE